MATAILMKGGGGGAGSDELTASADKVLSGYTYVGSDTDDEAGSGSMANIGALDAAKSVATGSNNVYFRMSRGAHLTNSSSGYPEAYAPYSSVASAVGLTSAKLLKGQTVLGVSGTATSDANATAAYIYSGKTAYVNGSKITGTMTISSVVSFSVAAYSATQFTCTWKWPSKGPYSGVIIRGKLGGYPSSVSDGQLYYKGTGSSSTLGSSSSQIIAGAQEGSSGTTYYFRIWVYCTTSLGELYSGYGQTSATTKARGQQTFTSSGTFTVPANVTKIDIFCVGGGGAGTIGNWTSQNNLRSGGGGAGGYTKTYSGCQVSPGQKLAVTVGAGGIYDSSGPITQPSGGTSSVDTLSASGGGGSRNRYPNGVGSAKYGGTGGSGGGGGWVFNGASNGGNADITSSNSTADKAYGQGTTTRAWGSSSGTLYSGGGSAGNAVNDGSYTNHGTGGSGGGGSAPSNVWGHEGVNGSANTGGGGSGAGVFYDGRWYHGNVGGNGGSGIVLIRWGY